MMTVPIKQNHKQRTVRWQRAAGYGNQFLCGQAAGNCQRRDDEEEPSDQHVEANRQVVPGRVGVDSGKGAAVIARAARIRVQDFGETVRAPLFVFAVAGPGEFQ